MRTMFGGIFGGTSTNTTTAVEEDDREVGFCYSSMTKAMIDSCAKEYLVSSNWAAAAMSSLGVPPGKNLNDSSLSTAGSDDVILDHPAAIAAENRHEENSSNNHGHTRCVIEFCHSEETLDAFFRSYQEEKEEIVEAPAAAADDRRCRLEKNGAAAAAVDDVDNDGPASPSFQKTSSSSFATSLLKRASTFERSLFSFDDTTAAATVPHHRGRSMEKRENINASPVPPPPEPESEPTQCAPSTSSWFPTMNGEREFLMCSPAPTTATTITSTATTADHCGGGSAAVQEAREVLVQKWANASFPGNACGTDNTNNTSYEKEDFAHQCNKNNNNVMDEEHNSIARSDTTSLVRQPLGPEPISETAALPTEVVFYRRKRDWDLPRAVKIHWHRQTNIKHFYGIHKWTGQLFYNIAGSKTKTVIGTIVCYELQPLSSVRKSGHGAVLLRSVDASLYKLSLLAASQTLQSKTLWSEHWQNLPLLLICNVYVPPPYRGLGLGLALIDDACRKPGRDIPWILTATNHTALHDYFALLGFVPQIFGDSFGARWNDLKRQSLPRIEDLCPHFPSSSLAVSSDRGKDDLFDHCEFNDEDELQIHEQVVLTGFPHTKTSSSGSHRRRRLWAYESNVA